MWLIAFVTSFFFSFVALVLYYYCPEIKQFFEGTYDRVGEFLCCRKPTDFAVLQRQLRKPRTTKVPTKVKQPRPAVAAVTVAPVEATAPEAILKTRTPSASSMGRLVPARNPRVSQVGAVKVEKEAARTLD